MTVTHSNPIPPELSVLSHNTQLGAGRKGSTRSLKKDWLLESALSPVCLRDSALTGDFTSALAASDAVSGTRSGKLRWKSSQELHGIRGMHPRGGVGDLEHPLS